MPRFLSLTLAVAALGCASRLTAAAPPNVVVILADDLGRADCGFMGGTQIKTPNIDKLAAAGAKLDAFYVQPVCSPTRAAFMTGRYPMRHGLQVGVVRPWADYGLPLDERTLPQALKEAGYATGIFGKWHLGHHDPKYLPTRRGFDRQYGHYNGAIDYFTHVRDAGFDWHKDDKECRDEGYSTYLIGREASQFVAENAGKKPFFLYVPFNAVHSPLQVPEKYTAAYPNLKGDRKLYAGMLVAMDEAVGRIAAAVDEAGARNNTLFLFSSDNGGPAPGRVTDNGKYRAGKGTLYEGGVRVAAFATWDGKIKPGSVVTEPMHIVDLFPTITKLAGASAEQKQPLDGKDVWPTLAEGKPTPNADILLNSTPNTGAIRAGDWKLVLNGGRDANQDDPAAPNKAGGPAAELFDLKADPYEKTNLATARPDKVTELRARYDRYATEAVPPKAKPKAKDFVTPKVWGEPVAAKVSARPNVVVIVGDDMGYADVGVHGCKDIPTPNIDALANAGVRFTNGYVSGPYCSPTRAGLLTGKYQTRFGHEFNAGGGQTGLPTDQVTLADRMKAVGYATGWVGKWHLGGSPDRVPLRRGFDEAFGFLGGAHTYFAGKSGDIFRGPSPVAETEYLTDAFGREAVAFIDRHKAEPFFLYLAFNAVHTPMEADDSRLQKFAHVEEKKRRTYCAMMLAMDDAVGRVTAKLKEAGLEDNTLVAFFSDNGGPTMVGTTTNASINAPLRGSKRSTLEGGVRVPFFLKWPAKLAAGSVYDKPVIQLDVLPTALTAAGVAAKSDWQLDGVDLMPYLTGAKAEAPHDALYWRFGQQMAIRKGDWKLVRYDLAAEGKSGTSAAKLYDLAADIGESTDLAAKLPGTVKDLQAAWDAWNRDNVPPLWGGGKKAKD